MLTKSEILDFMMTYPIQAAQTVLMEDDYPGGLIGFKLQLRGILQSSVSVL